MAVRDGMILFKTELTRAIILPRKAYLFPSRYASVNLYMRHVDCHVDRTGGIGTLWKWRRASTPTSPPSPAHPRHSKSRFAWCCPLFSSFFFNIHLHAVSRAMYAYQVLDALLAESARYFDIKSRRLAVVADSVSDNITRSLNSKNTETAGELQRLLPVQKCEWWHRAHTSTCCMRTVNWQRCGRTSTKRSTPSTACWRARKLSRAPACLTEGRKTACGSSRTLFTLCTTCCSTRAHLHDTGPKIPSRCRCKSLRAF